MNNDGKFTIQDELIECCLDRYWTAFRQQPEKTNKQNYKLRNEKRPTYQVPPSPRAFTSQDAKKGYGNSP